MYPYDQELDELFDHLTPEPDPVPDTRGITASFIALAVISLGLVLLDGRLFLLAVLPLTALLALWWGGRIQQIDEIEADK